MIQTGKSNLSTSWVQGTKLSKTVTREFQITETETKENQTSVDNLAAFSTWQSRNSDLETQLSKLESAVICKNAPDKIDFSSNQSGLSSIKK
ncbi:MAG: hypothetical protein NTZ74_06430 [Chloroflexi bacterium]|nr:hypothetical protein [Chloroflexota bacterium]